MARDEYLNSLYSLDGQVSVVTGGTGVLGGAMAMALAMAGARVGIVGRRASMAEEMAAAIQARGGEALAIPADVLDRDSLSMARDKLLKHWGAVHTLVNAAGGNRPAATVGDAADIFAMSPSAFQEVVELNLTGTLLPTLVFGDAIVKSGGGLRGAEPPLKALSLAHCALQKMTASRSPCSGRRWRSSRPRERRRTRAPGRSWWRGPPTSLTVVTVVKWPVVA